MDWKVLTSQFLSNLGSILGDPVLKSFSVHLMDVLEQSKNEAEFLESVSIDNKYLELPPGMNNFIRKDFNKKYCTLVEQYVLFVSRNNENPFNIHQAFVNTKRTVMDSQKLDIILLFSTEWT